MFRNFRMISDPAIINFITGSGYPRSESNSYSIFSLRSEDWIIDTKICIIVSVYQNGHGMDGRVLSRNERRTVEK